MSTHMPGFQFFFHHFVLAKLAISSVRVNNDQIIRVYGDEREEAFIL